MAFVVDFNTGRSGEKLEFIAKSLDNIAKKATEATVKLKGISGEVKKMSTETDKVAKTADSAAKSTKKLGDSNKKAEREVSETTKALRRQAQEAAALRAGLNALGTHMGIFTGQTILTAAAVYSTVSAFKGMIGVGVEFTGEMARALPIMGATAAEAKSLEAEVRRLGETTKFTGTEAAGGLTALGMSGMSAVQALHALEPALSLASIGQIDMYRSADILTNVMYGFGLSADDTTKIVDDLATAITSSNATIEQMANALSYVAPVAKAAGADLEEVTAILEVFHNAGIKGSRAGTSLRRAYANLQKPTDDAANTLFRLGVQTHDVNGVMLEMTDIMTQLAEAGATSADVYQLFGVRAAPAMEVFKASIDDVNKFRDALNDNENAAKDLREAFEQTLGADARKMISALQEKSIEVFKSIEDELRSGMQTVTEWIKAFDPSAIMAFLDGVIVLGKEIVDLSNTILTLGGAFLAYKAGAALVGVLSALGVKASLAATGIFTATASMLGFEVSVVSTTVALRGLLISTGVGAILVAIGVGAAYAADYLYDWINASDEATDSTARLRKEVEKTSTVEWKPPTRISDATIEDRQKLLDLINQTGSDDKNLGVLLKTLEDMDKFFATGISPEGFQRLAELRNEIESFSNISLQDVSRQIKSALSVDLKEIELGSKIGLTDDLGTYLAQIEAIESAETQIRAEAGARRSELIDKETKAKDKNLKLYGQLITQRLELEKQVQQQIDDLTQKRIAAREQLYGGDSAAGLIQSTNLKIQALGEEVAQIEAVNEVTKSSTELQLLAAAAKIEATLASEAAADIDEAEKKRLQEMVVLLKGNAEAYGALAQAKSDGEESKKAQAQVDKDFASGKFLAKEDKAQHDYDTAMEQLEIHRQLTQGKYENDEWYFNAKRELDMKLIKSQNEVWFEIAESSSRAIGDNIAKALTFQQSWSETGDNIKKAIIGSIVGSLVEVGTQILTNKLLYAIFGKEQMAMDVAISQNKMLMTNQQVAATIAGSTAETTAKVANEGIQTTAALGTAGANAAEAITNQGGGDPYSAFFRIAAMTAIMAGVMGLTQAMFSGSRATGGPISSTGSYLVGERGPEIFTPGVSGNITNNLDASRAGGGGGTEVHHHHHYDQRTEMTIKALDSKDVSRVLSEHKGDIYRLNDAERRRRGIRG